MKKHHLYEIDEQWKRGFEYYLIPTAQGLRANLLARLPEEFLSQYEARFCVQDVCLQTSYVEVVLRTDDKKNFYLRNVGYTERPKWEISGRDQQDKLFCEVVLDQELFDRLNTLLG